MKSDYRGIKDHNSRSGSNRRSWKWFGQMDAIYGGRPTSNGREGALNSAKPLLLENTIEDDSLSTIDSLALSTCNDDDSSSQAVLAASPPRPPAPSASSCTTTPQRVLTGKRKRSNCLDKHPHPSLVWPLPVPSVQLLLLNVCHLHLS
ncbi:uncharacterized protein Hap1MRO34_011307 [Clarias gariepinus]